MKLAFWRQAEPPRAVIPPTVEERASPENPSTPLSNPDAWLSYAFGAYPTKAGASVTPETAMRFNTVYACITLIAETMGQMPLVLYRATDGGREVVRDHPAARVVQNPNPALTRYRWIELQTGHALSWGGGYAHVERNIRGPLRLVPLMPDRTGLELINGELVGHTLINGARHALNPDDLLHIPAFSIDGIDGMSPIRAHAETIGSAIAARDFGSTFFGNNASLGGVLTHPKSLKGDALKNLKMQWDQLKGNGYQGTAVLEEGMEYKAIGIPPEEAQFIETRKFSRSEIAAIYKVPPHMVGDLERATFSNITEQSIQYLRYTLMPWVTRWEEELNRKLLTEQERDQGHYFKFTVQGLLRGTQTERYAAYNTAIQAGFMSRNEVRRLEEMNDVDGLDAFLEPMNMQPAGQPPEDQEPQDRTLFRQIRPVVIRACDALAALGNNAMVRLLKKGEDGFAARAEQWLASEDTAAVIDRHVAPIGEVLGDNELTAAVRDAFVQTWTEAIQRNRPYDITTSERDTWLAMFDRRYTETTP